MNFKLTLIAVLCVCTASNAQQKNDSKKPQLFGIHYNMSDFNSPAGIKNPGSSKGYSSIRDMNKGLSVSYWRGLCNKIDLAVKANAVFRDFGAIYQGTTGKTEVGIELEPTINVRAFPESAKLSPFLTLGAGVGMYNNKFGGFVPAGGGFQVNFESLTYLFVQAQYKFTLTQKVLGDNMFYSIGFAQKF
jgi:OmpA-OmpF porin, OOP family